MDLLRRSFSREAALHRTRLVLGLLAVLGLLWFVQRNPGGRVPTPAPDTPPAQPAEAGSGGAELRAAGDRSEHELGGARRTAARRTPGATGSELPPGSVRVRVVDLDGAPRGSVPVLLQFLERGTWWPKATRSTDAETAEVRFSNLQRGVSAAAPDTRWRVTLAIFGADAPRREFDAGSLPAETVVLVEPSNGAVEVDVHDLADQRLASGGTVSLRLAGPGLLVGKPPAAPPRLESTDDRHLLRAWTGVPVRFDRIGLGTELELSYSGTRSDVPTRLALVGPRLRGELVRSVLRVGADHPIVRVRLVDANGAPWIEYVVDVAIEYEGTGLFGGQFPGRTDETGRIELELDAGWSSALLGFTKDTHSARVELNAALPDGVTELGDVVFGPPPRIVAGRVLGPAGEALANAQIDVERAQRDGGQLAWRAHAQTDAAGAFEVGGWVEDRRFTLRAAAPGYLPREVEVERGARGLLLELTAAGSIAGSVLLDEGLPERELRVSAVARAEQPVPNAAPRETGIRGGSFRVQSLAPGVYDVAVALEGSPDVLVLVESVTVESGRAADDPRLVGIDLRGRLHHFPLEIVGYRGTERLAGTLRLGEAGSGVWNASLWLNSERRVLVAPWPSIDLEVQVAGYRTVHLRAVRGESRVELERGFPVRVALTGDADPPRAPYALGVGFVPLGSDIYRIDYGTPRFDARREVLLHSSEAGAVRLQWIIEQASTHGSDTRGVAAEPEQVFVLAGSDVEQRVEVRLTQAELERLVEQLRQ